MSIKVMVIRVSDRSTVGEMFLRNASLLTTLKSTDLVKVELLKWVGPWDDTTFNWRQAEAVVSELDLLIDGAADENAQGELIQLKELAQQATQRHRELLFIGD